MFVFTPGLPQRIAMIPDPDDQGTQPQWTMIIVGKWFLVHSKMLVLILQPFHGESAQEKLFPSNLRPISSCESGGYRCAGRKGGPCIQL
jgi:hypothetical protein